MHNIIVVISEYYSKGDETPSAKIQRGHMKLIYTHASIVYTWINIAMHAYYMYIVQPTVSWYVHRIGFFDAWVGEWESDFADVDVDSVGARCWLWPTDDAK